jgi:hypothetical protein
MIGYGPGHVKALGQISMVQRVRTQAQRRRPRVNTNTRKRTGPRGFPYALLTRIQDTLYHFGLA